MKKPTKAHIICHLIHTHGPMTKAALLEETAHIEGKPYRPDSNGSYFTPNPGTGPFYGKADQERMRKSSLVASGLIKVVGKHGNTLFYGLDVMGFEKVAEYQKFLQDSVK